MGSGWSPQLESSTAQELRAHQGMGSGQPCLLLLHLWWWQRWEKLHLWQGVGM